MKGEVMIKEPFSVMGVAKRGSHTNPVDSQVIASLWDEMMKRKNEVDNPTENKVITGICIPPASNDYFYIAGIETDRTDRLPEGMEVFTFNACKYLKFLHKGNVVNLFSTYGKIWGEWLPASGFQLAEGPELEIVNVEQFPNPFSEDYEMDIYIPIN